MSVAIPVHNSLPAISFALAAIIRHSYTISKNSKITMAQPIKPSSSPITAKIKSVCSSERKLPFFTVVIVLGIVFASGISYRWIVGTQAVVIPMIATGVYLLLHGMIPFIKEYQAGRILAWFYPEQYGEARYQQNNSIIAIGSGQLHGKGLYNTTIASVKNGIIQ